MDGASPPPPTALLNSLPNSMSTDSQTRILRRSDRSWRMKALQSSIRPFRSRLTRPSPDEPETENNPTGSPILIPPEKTFDHCNVRQVQYSTAPIRMYDINDRNNSTRENFVSAQIYDLANERKLRKISSRHEAGTALKQVQTHERENVISKDFATRSDGGRRRKHIYYFAGGGFRQAASQEQWILCAHLAHTLTKRGHPTTVTIVSYPLAPKHPASVSLKHLEQWYYEVLPSDIPEELRQKMGLKPSDPPEGGSLDLARTGTRYWMDDEDVIFAGDSSGANVALALPLHVISRNPAAHLPDGIFLICPPADLRNQNPEMYEVDKWDPVLGFKNAAESAKAWIGHGSYTQHQGNNVPSQNGAQPPTISPDDSRVSPLLGDIEILARRSVVVNGIIAGHDVLAPDAKLLMQKCQKHGVAGAWLVWDKQMHCFPLVFCHTSFLPESNEAIEWTMKRLMQGAD